MLLELNLEVGIYENSTRILYGQSQKNYKTLKFN